jgi:hypothetical protein
MSLKKLRLLNFQTHKKLSIKFSKGITTIVGTSDSGKSAIVRALYWLAFNKPAGNKFKTHGMGDVGVQLVVEDTQITRRKGKGRNSYTINGQTLKAFGAEPPEEVTKILQLQPFNFQHQHDPAFWLTLSAGEVAKRLNSVVDLSIIDKSTRAAKSALTRSNVVLDVSCERKEKAKQTVDKLLWVTDAYRDAQQIDKMAHDLRNRTVHAANLAEHILRTSVAQRVGQRSRGMDKEWSAIQRMVDEFDDHFLHLKNLEALTTSVEYYEKEKADLTTAKEQAEQKLARLDERKRVPSMPATLYKPALALFCSDWHLSHTPPVLRSSEPNWYAAQRRVVQEVKEIAYNHNCPIFFAGDLFHKWDSPAELINFALRLLPAMSMIYGQHDMPNHNAKQMNKSAYYTVAEYREDMNPIQQRTRWDGYPFGAVFGQKNPKARIALVHQYCWNHARNSFTGAQKSNHADILRSMLPGYEVIVVGDNHSHFIDTRKRPYIVNCGCMMRRSITELDYTPSVTLWYGKDKFERIALDTSKDVYLSTPKWMEDEPLQRKAFIGAMKIAEQLRALGDESLDFKDVVNVSLESRGVSKRVRQLVLRCIDE